MRPPRPCCSCMPASLLSLSACSPAGRFAVNMHSASVQASSRPVSRQPSSIRELLASVASEQPSTSSLQPPGTAPSRLQASESGLGPVPSDSPDLPPRQGRQVQALHQLLQEPGLSALPDLLTW